MYHEPRDFSDWADYLQYTHEKKLRHLLDRGFTTEQLPIVMNLISLMRTSMNFEAQVDAVVEFLENLGLRKREDVYEVGGTHLLSGDIFLDEANIAQLATHVGYLSRDKHQLLNGKYRCTHCGSAMDDQGGPGGICTPCCRKLYPNAKLGDITGDDPDNQRDPDVGF